MHCVKSKINCHFLKSFFWPNSYMGESQKYAKSRNVFGENFFRPSFYMVGVTYFKMFKMILRCSRCLRTWFFIFQCWTFWVLGRFIQRWNFRGRVVFWDRNTTCYRKAFLIWGQVVLFFCFWGGVFRIPISKTPPL